jgi:hypothetical protein
MKSYLTHLITAIVVTFSSILISAAMTKAQSIDHLALVKATAPRYDPVLVIANISGTSIIEVKINSRGVVTAARSIDGNKDLNESAAISARRWVFNQVNEDTGERTAKLTFVFRIMPKDTTTDDLAPIFMPPYQIEVRSEESNLIQTPSIDPPGRGYRSKRSKRKQ